MTAINLALRNRYGHVIWGNSLSNEQWRVYETGRVQVWGNAIRKVRIADTPQTVQQLAAEPPASLEQADGRDEEGPTQQLRLF